MSELRMGLVPSALVLPLRDAARGVGIFAARSRRLLKPSTQHLPGRLRDLAHDVIARAREAGEHTAFRRRPGREDIADAYGLLAGTVTLHRGAGPLAVVLAYALERCMGSEERDAPLVSETVLALAAADVLRQPGEAPDPALRAAELVQRLMRAPIAGAMPGTPLTLGEADRPRLSEALIAGVLWLLAERPANPAEEDAILELAFGLTDAAKEEITPLLGDPPALAAELHRLADVI